MESSSVSGKREAKDALEMKSIPKKLKSENKEEEEETSEGGLDETPVFVMTLPERKNRLHLSHLSLGTKISDILDFFEDDGEVVHARLLVNETGENLGYGSVHFASPDEAKQAKKNKNGQYLCGKKITLDLPKAAAPYLPPPMYCIDYVVWSEACQDETPHFVMSHAERKKTLVLSHLSLETKISDIVSFFKDAGEVVQVLLAVNKDGKNLGYGSVQFASSIEAEKAQENKNGEYLCGNKITLDVAKISPHRPQLMSKNEEHDLETKTKQKKKEEAEDLLKGLMSTIAPNLTALVGEVVGARLLCHYGSLSELAKLPGSKVPNLIYQASVVREATSKKRKVMIARSLCARVVRASEIDAFGESRDRTREFEDLGKLNECGESCRRKEKKKA